MFTTHTTTSGCVVLKAQCRESRHVLAMLDLLVTVARMTTVSLSCLGLMLLLLMLLATLGLIISSLT